MRIDEPRQPLVHRQHWVPVLVKPFFLIFPVHMGHRGLFALTEKANQMLLAQVLRDPGIGRKRPVNSSGEAINGLKTYGLVQLPG